MSLSYKRDSLTNFRAQKARENLRREMGAEEIRRASEKKMEGCWGKKGTVPICFGISYFVTKCAALYTKGLLIRTIIMVRENSFRYSFIVI